MIHAQWKLLFWSQVESVLCVGIAHQQFVERVDLRCADKVILAETLNSVRVVANDAVRVVNFQDRVMIFPFRNPRDGIREDQHHGVRVKAKVALNCHRLMTLGPSLHLPQVLANLWFAEGWCISFASATTT